LAIEIIREAIADADDRDELFALAPAWIARTVFEGNEAGTFVIPHWTAHDLRRSALTHMARLGVAPIVLAHVANHVSATQAGVTMSVYARYDYGREVRAALELWAERLQAIVVGAAKVVPMVRP
jgi:integrase